MSFLFVAGRIKTAAKFSGKGYQLKCGLILMRGQIIEDDYISWSKGWNQNVFRIDPEYIPRC